MSVYLMNVLPNGFYDDKDKKKARAFLRETKAKLSKLFPNAHGYISYWDDEDFFSLDFSGENFELSLNLHHGFWYLDPFFDSWEFFKKHDGEYYAREYVRMIAKELGINEIWHITYDVKLWSEYDIHVERCEYNEWVNLIKAQFDPIPDASDEVLAEMVVKYPECYYGRPFIYHDLLKNA